jgi:hypothetical protein
MAKKRSVISSLSVCSFLPWLLKICARNIERWPQFRINPKRRIYVALCPCNIALSQLIACVATKFHHRPPTSAGLDDYWYIRVRSRSPGNNCDEE